MDSLHFLSSNFSADSTNISLPAGVFLEMMNTDSTKFSPKLGMFPGWNHAINFEGKREYKLHENQVTLLEQPLL